MSKELPKDWKCLKMGEIFTIERGGSPRPIEDFVTEDSNGINWIKIGDTKGVVKYIYKTKEKIKPAGASRSRMVYEDDFILSNSMSFGKPFIMKTTGCIHDGWLVIRKNETIDNNFLYYILSSPIVFQQFTKLAKGSTVKNLNIEAVKQVELRIPSKPTQLAIVSKIEELFSEIENGIKSLFTAQQQLKTYRQSVLKWAFEGKLTNSLNYDLYDLADEHDLNIAAEPETEYVAGRNHKNHKNQKNHGSDKGELPEGWKKVRLGEVIEKPKYGTSKKCGYKTEGIGVLRIPNIVKGIVDSDDLKFAEFDGNEISIYNLKEGDILTIRSNGSVDIVGKCALITKKDEAFLYAGYLIRLRPLKRLILPKYLINILSSVNLRNQIEGKAKSTSGVNNINAEELSGLEITIPPNIEEQQKVVQEIESRLSVADKMEESITESLQQAEALKQSILKKAFEGKLI